MYTPIFEQERFEVELDKLLLRTRICSNPVLYIHQNFNSFVSTIINEGKMKNEKSRGKSSKVDLVWVNTQLTDQDQADFLSTEPSDADILQGLLSLTTAGYELVVKHDAAATCYRVYLFNKVDFDSIDYGLSCFAGTSRDALHLLLFKFYTVMDGSWPDPSTATSRPKFG